MLMQCSCGRTISISTRSYLTASASMLESYCLEGKGYDQGNPFAGSYLETGDRDIPEDSEVEDPEEYDDVIGEPERDFSIYTDSVEFEE